MLHNSLQNKFLQYNYFDYIKLSILWLKIIYIKPEELINILTYISTA